MPHLNLPTKISFGSAARIEYLYNAAGVKLQKTVVQDTLVATTLYFDGFQYFNNVLEMFPQAEGYVKNTVVNGTNVYNYAFDLRGRSCYRNCQDHVGGEH